MTDLETRLDRALKAGDRADATEIEATREASRDRVLRTLRNAQPSGRWCSWRFLQDTCGSRYGRAIHELTKAKYVIDSRSSQTQRQGRDYLLISSPSQPSLPGVKPRKLSKGAKRMQDMIVRELRYYERCAKDGVHVSLEEITDRIEAGEHLTGAHTKENGR